MTMLGKLTVPIIQIKNVEKTVTIISLPREGRTRDEQVLELFAAKLNLTINQLQKGFDQKQLQLVLYEPDKPKRLNSSLKEHLLQSF